MASNSILNAVNKYLGSKAILLGLLLFAAACGQPNPKISRAFYHWKGNYSPDQSTLSRLDSVAASTIYLRVFDIDLQNGQPMPVGQVAIETLDAAYNYIPVVFITNRSLAGMDTTKSRQLGERIAGQMQHLTGELGWEPKQVQLDCDWTVGTAQAYFALLRGFKSQWPRNTVVSATIRLHQVKYASKTGIPPVDRGMLMFYNMGELDDEATSNSILDLEVAQQYLVNFDTYALPLDLALPIFSWAVVFRDGKVVRLANGVAADQMNADVRFELTPEGYWLQTESGFWANGYGYRHDLIRIETVSPSLCQEAAALALQHIKNDSIAIALYHLDSTLLTRYDTQALQAIYSAGY